MGKGPTEACGSLLILSAKYEMIKQKVLSVWKYLSVAAADCFLNHRHLQQYAVIPCSNGILHRVKREDHYGKG